MTIDADEIPKITLTNNSPESDIFVLGTVGFLATVKFSVITSANITFYVGASPDTLLLVSDWTRAADGTNGDIFDVTTKARYLKIVISSANPFNCAVRLVRQ